jgi:hypothetical protein
VQGSGRYGLFTSGNILRKITIAFLLLLGN